MDKKYAGTKLNKVTFYQQLRVKKGKSELQGNGEKKQITQKKWWRSF